MKFVYLEVTTWVGSSVTFAQHFMARMYWIVGIDPLHGGKVWEHSEVERVLTAQETESLNASERRRGRGTDEFHAYEEGDTSSRFLSEEALYAAAKAQWRKECPEADALMVSHHYTLDPALVLDGDPNMVITLNMLYNRAVELDFWEKKEHEAEMKIVYNNWKAIVEHDHNSARNEA